MRFWASAETFIDADANQNSARICVERYLTAAFGASRLSTLDVLLRYIPIIMPEGLRGRYPARSELHKKKRIYDCAPQLNCEVFVDGSFEDQPREYIRGIAKSAPHLAGLGATSEQIEDFKAILATAADRILVERPDATRH